MYLVTQTKNATSALELARQLKVAYNIDWSVKHKLTQAMMERDDTRALDGIVQMDDAYWRRQRHGGKRGRGAPGKTPFVAAVELTDRGRPMAMRLSRVQGFANQALGYWACRHLISGTVVHTDALAGFAAVKTAGCVHRPKLTGGGQ